MKNKEQAEIVEPCVSAEESFFHMQGELPTVPKTRQGFNFQYAPYETVIRYALPVMQRYGFSITFAVEHNGSVWCVRADLLHRGTPFRSSLYPIGESKLGKDQEFGKSLTYGKRYLLVLLLGIAIEGEPDVDDAGVPQVKEVAVEF